MIKLTAQGFPRCSLYAGPPFRPTKSAQLKNSWASVVSAIFVFFSGVHIAQMPSIGQLCKRDIAPCRSLPLHAIHHKHRLSRPGHRTWNKQCKVHLGLKVFPQLFLHEGCGFARACCSRWSSNCCPFCLCSHQLFGTSLDAG